MRYLVDGSNLLGVMRLDRESAESKRALLRALSSFARDERAKVICWFDGSRPAGIGAAPAGVTVRFSHPEPADEPIVREVRSRKGEALTVVTSDAALRARCGGRKVETLDARAFAGRLSPGDEGDGEGSEEWERYFSDGENRSV